MTTTTEAARANKPILPGQTLGVLGGGQLGRMFCHAAQRMGYFTAVLDADSTSPAGRVSHSHIQAEYTDAQALAELGTLCAAVTTEFENVPADSLAQLSKLTVVSPSASAVAIAQDRSAEKAHFARCGVATAPYFDLISAGDCKEVSANKPDLFPAILKTARLGYDGKGQVTVTRPEDLLDAWHGLGAVACVLEKRLALAKEISVIVARGRDGVCVNLPVQQNLHRGGILAVTEVYSADFGSLGEQAVASAKAIATGLDYVGVLCVEFFVLEDGRLVVNEMAPRPHNSGHYSIEACDVSQFELQVRTLCGLPLTQPVLRAPSVMLNLLGDIWLDFDGAPPWSEVLTYTGVALHLYGKLDAKVGRKMGHITISAAEAEEAKATALQVARLLHLAPF